MGRIIFAAAMTAHTLVIWLTPLFCALAGWLGIRLLLRLLFRPAEPKRVLGIKVQGIIPANQPQIAEAIGKTVANDLLRLDTIAEKMQDPVQIAALMPGIEAHIDAFLQQRLKEKIPVLAMFLSDSVLQMIRGSLLDEIAALLPTVIGQYTQGLSTSLNIEEKVREKLGEFPAARLEAMMQERFGRELRLAGMLGAGAGFLLGLVQTGLLYWAQVQ
jgi:uncharacterized membrane protein YheB (UPF0754 family)